MKKVSFIFIIGIIVGVLFIGGNVLRTSTASIEKKSVSKMIISDDVSSGIDVNAYFINADENHDPLDNSRFTLSTWDGKYRFYSFNPEPGVYGFSDRREVSFDNMMSLLTDKEKKIVESINNKSDLVDYYNSKYGDNDGSPCYTNNDEEICNLSFIKQMKLEQTRVQNGYVKQKYTVPVILALVFINDNDNLILDEVVLTTSMSPNGMILLEYGDYIDTFSTLTDEDQYFDFLEEKAVYDNTYCSGRIDTRNQLIYLEKLKSILGPVVGGYADPYPSFFRCAPLVMNERGSLNLSINTSVNEQTSINTTSNTKLAYRVNVNNNGLTSYDNKVVSKLPEGFTYVEGSASNNGVYDSQSNTITWTLLRIDEGDHIGLSYEAYAPSGLSSLKSYVSEASIENSELQNKIVSNKAIVRLLVNPKTDAPIIGIGITLLITWGVAIYLYIESKRKLIRQ